MLHTFEDVTRNVIDRLASAAKDRKSPMHTPAVVTSDVDARTMVLRDFDAAAWTLRFHTDTRAPKVAAIEADPRMAVLFYDKPAKIQIRVRGEGRILRSGLIADRAWDRGDNFARRCYLGEGPGTVSDEPISGLPPEFEGVEPADEELIPARENFAVLMVELNEIDWFYLAHTGHVRAKLVRSDGDRWEGRWVSP
ncbi:pyridoxamine 5'-phosphate oxidase family protein [Erythrobacter ani]|uniref:Pyridoxamine 5'-phosphate oxidase family protein n=1 Tax=Erythrobacter ani TaxID=2827235 RepID=A0ABS6SHX8_9SPHN|nr:pyridoxamine 5'-phosphate oxidase family protein [Erythrobacter ani]MBV7264618.1 pyridoxamine 5'-phosphate oxidase family protein [Erythrobacter ani]